MSCPICAAPESATIAAGIRAGALVLMIVIGALITLFARFALRLWRRERWVQS